MRTGVSVKYRGRCKAMHSSMTLFFFFNKCFLSVVNFGSDGVKDVGNFIAPGTVVAFAF